MIRSLLALSVIVLSACNPDGATDPDDTDVGTPGVAYYPEVREVLDTSCLRCHSGEGPGVGDFSDPDVAVILAERLLIRTSEGTMPPPVTDPDCRDFLGSERLTISQDNIDILAAWIDNGKPIGDPEDMVTVEPIVTELDTWDLEIQLPNAYAPTFSDESNPGNEYRCFYLETGLTETQYITAMSPVIDEPGLIHHVVAYVATSLPNNYDPTKGKNCINNASPGAGMLAGWAPGGLPVEFDEGYGLKIEPGQYVVMQMHYFDNGLDSGVTDQSGYHFKLTDSVDYRVIQAPLGKFGSFSIPPGEQSTVVTESFDLPALIDYQVTIHGTFPHMHGIGSAYSAGIVRPDGTEECVARSDQWDFDNQMTFMFKDPPVVQAGDGISISCTYDSSDRTETTHDGERTDEEMCFAFTFLSTEPPGLIDLVDEYLR